MTAPTDRAIDVRALWKQAGMDGWEQFPYPFDVNKRMDFALTHFARLVLEEAAKACDDWESAWAAARAIRRLAPEEGKPGAPTS